MSLRELAARAGQLKSIVAAVVTMAGVMAALATGFVTLRDTVRAARENTQAIERLNEQLVRTYVAMNLMRCTMLGLEGIECDPYEGLDRSAAVPEYGSQ